MQLLKASSASKISASNSTVIWEYLMDDQNISGAIAEIHGRYPEKGFVKNEISKELVYVLDGSGKVILPDGEHHFAKGDTVLLLNGETYAWEGNFRIFMATAPKFDPKQHKVTK